MTFEKIKESVSNIPSYILDDDLKTYYKHVSVLPENSIVLDIGTGLGKSAIALALSNLMVQVITIDNAKYPIERGWTKSKVDYKHEMRREFKKRDIENIELIVDEAESVLEQIKFKLDLFHLDGEKETEIGLLKLVFPKLDSGGIILLRNFDRMDLEEIKEILNQTTFIGNSGKIRIMRKR